MHFTFPWSEEISKIATIAKGTKRMIFETFDVLDEFGCYCFCKNYTKVSIEKLLNMIGLFQRQQTIHKIRLVPTFENP